MKIANKTKLQQIASNSPSNIDFKDLTKLFKDYTKEQFSFLLNGTTFSSDNQLKFRRSFL